MVLYCRRVIFQFGDLKIGTSFIIQEVIEVQNKSSLFKDWNFTSKLIKSFNKDGELFLPSPENIGLGLYSGLLSPTYAVIIYI